MPKKPIKSKKNADDQEDSQDLQRRIDELLDDAIMFDESEDMPEGLHNQFMDYITAFEEAEWVTTFDVLVQGGMELPRPDELDDTQLSRQAVGSDTRVGDVAHVSLQHQPSK